MTVPELLQTPPFYTELNKANLSVSAYLKFVAAVNCGSLTGEYAPEIKFWEPINRGLVPDILGIGVTQDREEPIRPYRLLFKSPTSDKKIFIGTKVGFAVLDADDKLVTDTLSAYYWISSNEDEWIWNDNKSSYDCVIKLDPGKDDYVTYRAYPMVQFMGGKVLVDQMKEFKLDPARIDIAEREIFLGKDLGYREIEVVPNMENMEVKAEADWLNATKPIWLAHKNELTIYWPDLPGDVKDRRGVIRLIGKSQKGETLVEDSIVVVQFEPFMELTPDKLEFDKKGGTKTITIGKTNVTNLAVSTSTEDITAVLEGKTVTVTMGENTSEEERGGSVYVEGKTPEGKTVKFFVTVTQEGGDPKSNNELKLSMYSLETSAKDKSDTIYVETPDIKDIKCSSDQEFLRVRADWYNHKRIIRLIFQSNLTTKDRYATVTITATLANDSTVTATVSVVQKGYFEVYDVRLIPSVMAHAYKTFEGEDKPREITYKTMGIPTFPDNYFTRTNIKTTRLDDGSARFEGIARSENSFFQTETVDSISFDMPEEINSSVIKNLVWIMQKTKNGETVEKVTLKATDIPLTKDEGSKKIYEATEKDGLNVTELTVVYDFVNEGLVTYSLKNEDSNSIRLEIRYSLTP